MKLRLLSLLLPFVLIAGVSHASDKQIVLPVWATATAVASAGTDSVDIEVDKRCGSVEWFCVTVLDNVGGTAADVKFEYQYSIDGTSFSDLNREDDIFGATSQADFTPNGGDETLQCVSFPGFPGNHLKITVTGVGSNPSTTTVVGDLLCRGIIK